MYWLRILTTYKISRRVMARYKNWPTRWLYDEGSTNGTLVEHPNWCYWDIGTRLDFALLRPVSFKMSRAYTHWLKKNSLRISGNFKAKKNLRRPRSFRWNCPCKNCLNFLHWKESFPAITISSTLAIIVRKLWLVFKTKWYQPGSEQNQWVNLKNHSWMPIYDCKGTCKADKLSGHQMINSQVEKPSKFPNVNHHREKHYLHQIDIVPSS